MKSFKHLQQVYSTLKRRYVATIKALKLANKLQSSKHKSKVFSHLNKINSHLRKVESALKRVYHYVLGDNDLQDTNNYTYSSNLWYGTEYTNGRVKQ